MNEVILFLNQTAWVVANFLVGYIAIAILVFVVGYYILFDPRATTAGKLIFQFMLSLVGVIGLIYISTYIDPVENRIWTDLPKDVEPWRPAVRLVVYSYVTYTITLLGITLALRKWFPEKLRTKPENDIPVKVRHHDEDYRFKND